MSRFSPGRDGSLSHEQRLRYMRRWALVSAALALPFWAVLLALDRRPVVVGIAAVTVLLTVVNVLVLSGRISRAKARRQ